MTDNRPRRFNVVLDEEHAAMLHQLADQTYVQPGTLARSLLSTALDQADRESDSVTAILDAIPGAYERAMEGLRAAQAGRAIRLEDL